MDPQQAETLALEVLQFIAADERIFAALEAQTGIGPDELRVGATDPGVLGALLDFLLENDKNVMAFCDAWGHPPEDPMKARLALPGATAGLWS